MHMATMETFELTPADLSTLCEALQPVAAKWYDIGLQMKIPSYKLDIVRADHAHEGVRACLREVLKEWLRSLEPETPSWPNLMAVLRTKSIGEYQLAAELEKGHCPHPQLSEVIVPDFDEESDHEAPVSPISKTIEPDKLLRIFKQGNIREKTDGVLVLLKAADTPISLITDENDKTLLHWACRNNWVQWLPMASTLVEVFSCNPSAQDRFGDTPLHDACKYDNQKLAEYLLSLESYDPNIRNARMETALHFAKESPDMVRILLASGLVDNSVVEDVLQVVSTSDDPLAFRDDVKMILEDYIQSVKQHDSPAQPFLHKTCCIVLSILERSLLCNKTKCTVDDIVAFSSDHGIPLPSNSAKICELLSEISARKLYKVIEHSQPGCTVVEKRPPGYQLEGNKDDDVTSRDLVISLLKSEVDVGEYSGQYTEMETVNLESMYRGAHEQVEHEFHQAMPNLSESPLPATTPEYSDKNTVPDNTSSSHSPKHVYAQKQHDREDNESRGINIMEPLVDRTSNGTGSTGSQESSLDDVTDSAPLLSDHGTKREHEHRGDSELDDDSRVRSVALWRKMLAYYSLCHVKLYGCAETHKIKCCAGVIGAFISLGISLVFMLVLLVSSATFSATGSFFAVPYIPVPAMPEGFDAYYVSRVELHNDDENDPRKISYYTVQTPDCSIIPTINESVNSSFERPLSITDFKTTLNSIFLLPGSKLTFELKGISSTNCSVMAYIFDDVNAHLQYIYGNNLLGAIDTYCLSSNSPNFTIVASKPSHYVSDIYFTEPYPASITYVASGNALYYNTTDIRRVDTVPGLYPIYYTTWQGGIVTEKESEHFCILVKANDKSDDEPGTLVKVDYVATRKYLQNAENLAFLILCVLAATPIFLLLLFGVEIVLFALVAHIFVKCKQLLN